MTATRHGPAWTQPKQLVAVLRRRWDTGLYLRAYAAGAAWQPVELPVKGPGAGDLLEDLDACRRWVAQFEREAVRFAVEYREVRGRHLGTNPIPARVRVESFEQLCRILDTSPDVRLLDDLTARTRTKLPALAGWVADNPLVALRNAGIWDQALATVQWIAAHDPARVYIRQIDVERVDTKFVERHHKLLDQLLTVALPPERIDHTALPSTFVKRFRFLEKPGYTRLRFLDRSVEGARSGFTEIAVRTDELATRDPGASSVFVVENEVTYLAFPPVADAIVVFGSGFALAGLAHLPWLPDKQVVYWGDIDTYGFDILNRLRSRLPSVRSILMDRQTLMAHSAQWVTEPAPTTRSLPHLDEQEAALYRDVVEDTYGPAVRLEQERVRFSILDSALRAWSTGRGNHCDRSRTVKRLEVRASSCE